MAHFDKFGNLSLSGWDKGAMTLTVAVGKNAYIGLWGAGPGNEKLDVDSSDPTVCVVHEEAQPKAWPAWRLFIVTALRAGEARIEAVTSTGANYAAPVKVKAVGTASARLVFFPGERVEGSALVGAIYAIGAQGQSIKAAGGPAAGYKDRGGHTAESTPAGLYTLGRKIHVVAPSWPMSAIPWGAALRLNKGEAEFESAPGVWRAATGPAGVVTLAQKAFLARDGKQAKPGVLEKLVRNIFIDPATGALRASEWKKNDFGRWGWNLLRGGQPTAYFIHTTPEDEEATEQGQAVFLANSHGCVHLKPAERDRLMNAGLLKEGASFEVRPYSETGPP